MCESQIHIHIHAYSPSGLNRGGVVERRSELGNEENIGRIANAVQSHSYCQVRVRLSS